MFMFFCLCFAIHLCVPSARCLGNLAPVQREPLQLNVTAFHENRLSLTLRVVDSSQPLTCRMAFLKEPRKDRQGNVHAICNLNIDASEEVGQLPLTNPEENALVWVGETALISHYKGYVNSPHWYISYLGTIS